MTHLALSHLRFRLAPEEPLHLPAHNKGNSLRGGFGSAFRKLVCVDLRWECADCALRCQCPYTAVFNPFVPPEATQLSTYRDIPRPFAVKPPLSAQTRYETTDAVVFDMVLAGKAIDYLPYFVVTFRELGASGFGLERTRVRLDRVDAVGADGSLQLVYDAGTNVVCPAPPVCLPVDAPLHGVSEGPETLAVEFLTPTTLKAGSSAERQGELVRRPAFHHVLKRLRDRVSSLCAFYGPGPLDLDFKALGEAAERVETVADETRWVERTRLSRRRGVAHDLSGFAGKITFRGEMAPFLPLLRIGEYVHVGKNAVFGNGWYVLHHRQ